MSLVVAKLNPECRRPPETKLQIGYFSPIVPLLSNQCRLDLYFFDFATIINSVFHSSFAVKRVMHELKAPGQAWYPRRVTILLLAVFHFCCSPILFTQEQANAKPTNITVSGTVVNSVTHEPIGRAMVYSRDSRYATFTDNSGRFELTIETQEPEGNNRVRMTLGSSAVLQVKKPGFLVEQGAQGHAVVEAMTKEVTLSLVPEALIVGHVKFPSSETANEAQVTLYRREVREGLGRWERLSEVRTRSDGEYRFAELRAGQYKLYTPEAVDRDPLTSGPGGPTYGFPPRFFAEAHDFASADVIELHAGQTFVANMTPERQRYYEVTIPVGPPDAARQGVMVTVRAHGQRGPGFELGYDPDRQAIRGSLPNGSYMVEATSFAPSPATGSTNITAANGPVLGPAVVLATNPSIEVNIRAQLSASNSSQTQTQQPTPGAYVTLQSAEEFSAERGPGMSYESQPDPLTQGGVRLEGVKPGRYWVLVQPNSSDQYAAAVTSGLTDLLRAPLVVPVGSSVNPIEVTLRDDGGSIEATVEGAPQQVPVGVTGAISYSGPMRGPGFDPMGGVYVYAIPVGAGGTVGWFNGINNGKYVIQRLPPGDYRVVAFDSQQEIESRNPAALKAYESAGQVVHVSARETAKVKVKLASGN